MALCQYTEYIPYIDNDLQEAGIRERIETRVGVLDKVVEVLRAFSGGEVDLSPREIAVRTSLPLPTVYRLLQALGEHEFLERTGSRYRLGLALLHLGTRVAEGLEIRRQSLPHLEWLNDRTGENAELHIRREETRVPLELVRSSHNLRPFVEIGAPLPLHLGAPGKVLLAWLPDKKRDSLAAASAARFDGERPFDAEALREQLARIRAAGWAASNGERSPSVGAIAAPVFDASGGVEGALLVSAPSVRLSAKRVRELAPLVREAAARASVDLGHAGSAPFAEEGA